MRRRTVLASIGTAGIGLLAGCPGSGSGGDPPRLVGVQVGNWYPEPRTVNVDIRADDDDVLYETQVRLPAGDPSVYNRPSRTLDDHPTEIPASATLSTWLESDAVEEANTVDLGAHPCEECIGVQIDVCSECERQKGQADTVGHTYRIFTIDERFRS